MKMDPLTALCFPDTVSTFATAAPLLLLLDQLVHYRPTESTADAPPLFTDPPLLQSYAPVPVGDNLDLFLRMVKDLRGHGAEYSSGFLASLSPAMVASYQDESVRHLLKALTHKDGELPEKTTAPDESLWRSRLLLQLAEEMYRDEHEIADHLAKVGTMKQRMLESLLGDDNAEETELDLPTLPAIPPRMPIRDDLICRAWCRLFLADRNERRPALAATASNEAAELLMDTFAQGSGRPPISICTLALPSLIGMTTADYLARRTAFRATATDLLADIAKAIETAMQTGQAVLDHKKAASQWQEAFLQHFSDAASGAVNLQITLLPGATLADLCQRLGKSDAHTPAPGVPHTVLVHLAPHG